MFFYDLAVMHQIFVIMQTTQSSIKYHMLHVLTGLYNLGHLCCLVRRTVDEYEINDCLQRLLPWAMHIQPIAAQHARLKI
jgi:hypothetical protein